MKVLICSSALSYQMDAAYSTRMRANAMVRAGLSVTVTGFPEKYPGSAGCPAFSEASPPRLRQRLRRGEKASFAEASPDDGREHLFEYVSVQSLWPDAKRRRFQEWKSRLGNYGIFLFEPWCVMKTAYQMAEEREMDIVYLAHLEPCVLWPLVHILKWRRRWRMVAVEN